MTAGTPASSATLACPALTTCMMTPPLGPAALDGERAGRAVAAGGSGRGPYPHFYPWSPGHRPGMRLRGVVRRRWQ